MLRIRQQAQAVCFTFRGVTLLDKYVRFFIFSSVLLYLQAKFLFTFDATSIDDLTDIAHCSRLYNLSFLDRN